MEATKVTRRLVAPGLWQLGRNEWEFRVKARDPTTGKVRRVWRQIQGSRADATRARDDARTSIAGGRSAPRRETLRVFARSWLEQRIALGDLERSTQGRYATALDVHLLPTFGDWYLDAIGARDVAAWLAAKVAEGHAAISINGWLRTLRTVLQAALRAEVVGRNVAALVPALPEPPPVGNTLSADELRAFLAAWRQHQPQWFALVMTLALTGLRWGEATALRWDDIDGAESAHVLSVERAHHRGRIKTTKSRKPRQVPMLPVLVEVLRDHRRALVARQAPGLSEGWVFPSRAGTLLDNGRLSKPWREVLRLAGIKHRVTVHGLRRTMVDLLRRAEVDREVRRLMVGHADERIHSRYSSVATTETRIAGERVLALVAPATRGQFWGQPAR